MTIVQVLVLAGVGFVSGAMNAVVGGGTFFSFPVLLAIGLPPIAANATSTVALWPASVAASRAYVPELRRARETLLFRSVVAVAGGAAGAFLLLASGDALFSILVPWLIALATLLFTFNRVVRKITKFGGRTNALLVLGLEFLFAVYGGYFGAGVGVLLMAALALGGENDAQAANAQKNLLASCINGAAVVIFIAKGAVLWPVALVVMSGAIAGGYWGARAARLIPADTLRLCVIFAGCVLSVIYFFKAYGGPP